MKVVILAGGFGTRISEESTIKPKPMIEIGSMPILWHIMKIYSSYGFNDFIICAGYKQRYIKEWFANYFFQISNITFDYTSNERKIIVHDKQVDPWRVTVVDTGLNTQTGGRIKRIRDYVGDEPFMVTYGDAVGDMNIKEILECHKKSGKIGTISLFNYYQNKGIVEIDENNNITDFREKSNVDNSLINIGYMVMEPEIFDLIDGDDTPFEKEPMARLIARNELNGYIHKGYWQCMDTLREKKQIEELWNSGNAPWKLWDND